MDDLPGLVRLADIESLILGDDTLAALPRVKVRAEQRGVYAMVKIPGTTAGYRQLDELGRVYESVTWRGISGNDIAGHLGRLAWLHPEEGLYTASIRNGLWVFRAPGVQLVETFEVGDYRSTRQNRVVITSC